MAQVTVLEFSLRRDVGLGDDNPYPGIEKALGCRFKPTVMGGTSVLMATLFGMDIIFVRWRGVGGADVFQLHGVVTDVRYLDAFPAAIDHLHRLDISAAVIDLLQAYGQRGWRVPRPEEVDAEIEHDQEIHRARKIEDTGPDTDEPW